MSARRKIIKLTVTIEPWSGTLPIPDAETLSNIAGSIGSELLDFHRSYNGAAVLAELADS